MIYIREDLPQKLSGITTLHIKFDFNQEVINIIKQCNKYNYDKKSYTWEVPINSLSFLLDNLTYVDDITLSLKKEDNNIEKLIPKNINNYRTKPFKHQLEGIEYGLNNNNWLLLDSPGLGKSIQMIYLAEELKAQKGLEHCLIICGINTLKTNWKKEIKKHSNLDCRILGEKISKKGNVSYASIKERAAELMNPINEFFIITNIETLRSDDIIQAFRTTKNKIGMIVLDEAHKCKGTSATQSNNLLKLKDYDYKIALTGTLLMNKPIDAFVPLKWIGKEKATLTNFKSQYCEFGGFGGHQIIGFKNIDILKELIDSCSLRRTKDILEDLPPKTVIKEIIELDDQHRKFYDNVKNGVKEECDKIELKAGNVLALTTRLRQATACPSSLTTTPIMSSKIQRAVDLVEEICSQGNKVVIMSTFKDPVDQLKLLLKDYNPLIGYGDMKEDIDKNVDLFQTDDKYKVFICTSSKCGTGITLNAASYMIMLDTPFTYAATEQCEDRIHRIGSHEPVFIYRLICQNTFDEIVDNIVETKKAISDFIIDDKLDANTVNLLRTYIQEL